MLEIIIALAAAIFLGNTLAHRIRVTPAILLIFLRLALALLPAMHELREVGLPSYVILEIFLPIMLFWEARNTSLREVRKSLRAIITSGTVLVIVTAFAMAGVLTHFFHIDWGTALIIGAALAPTDATAVATLNGKLPKRSITVLKAESLINDGTTLVVFALAIQVAGGADLSVSHAGGMLAFSFLCGIAVGLAVGWVANRLRARIANPMNFVIYMMTIPFVAFFVSESIEISEGMKGSGVVAVVVSAFYLTYYGVDTIKPQNRFYGLPIWAYMSYLMNGAIFVLVGVQLPEVWQNISEAARNNATYSQADAIIMVVTIWLVSLLVRFLFMRPAMLSDIKASAEEQYRAEQAKEQRPLRERHELHRLIRAALRDPKVRSEIYRDRAVSTMAGLRGGVSLAVALSVSTSVPNRDFIIFMVAAVVMVSMLVQGLSLPAIIRWAKIPADDTEHQETLNAVGTMNKEAYDALEDLAAQNDVGPEALAYVRYELDFQHDTGIETCRFLQNNPDLTPEELQAITLQGQVRTLRLAIIGHQREVLKRLRNEGVIDMNVLHSIQERLDTEEIRITGPVELE